MLLRTTSMVWLFTTRRMLIFPMPVAWTTLLLPTLIGMFLMSLKFRNKSRKGDMWLDAPLSTYQSVSVRFAKWHPQRPSWLWPHGHGYLFLLCCWGLHPGIIFYFFLVLKLALVAGMPFVAVTAISIVILPGR